MKFRNLDIQNFMSVSNISTRLDNLGLVLIKGVNDTSEAFESNGSGKSTIFSESIVWCLFGETIRGYKGNEVVNRTAGKDTLVSLEILDNEAVYRVERYRKHKEHKNSVLLFKDDVNITGKSDADTTLMIEGILQIDFLSFTNSILFGQGISKKFSGSTDAEQKKILERMLQIDLLRECQDIAKTRVAHTNKAIESTSASLETLRDKRTSILREIESLQIKELDAENEVLNKIASLEGMIKEAQDYIKGLPDIEGLQEERKNLMLDLSDIDSELEEFQVSEDEHKKESTKNGVTEFRLSMLGQEINSKLDRVEDMERGGQKPKTCKSCGQTIPVKDLSAVIEELLCEVDELNANYDDLEKARERSLEKLSTLEEILKKRNPIIEERGEIYSELKEVNLKIKHTQSDIERQNKSIANLEHLILIEESQLGITYKGLIEERVEEAENIKNRIESLDKDMQENKEILSNEEFWVTAFGNQGIKSMLLDSITPFLNTRANYYLHKLTEGTMDIKLDTQTAIKTGEKRDKFSIQVNNSTGGDGYKGCSGGEKQRVDVSINMALQDLVLSRSNKKIDFIVMDECFEALDGVGCEMIMELLQEKAKHFGTVLVITHNNNLSEHFSNIIEVVKSEGKSTIED